MTAADVTRAVAMLQDIAGLFPSPLSEYVKAGLALVDEAVRLGNQKDPLATLDELRAILRAGITGDIQQELDKKP